MSCGTMDENGFGFVFCMMLFCASSDGIFPVIVMASVKEV
jgi:hypothetical protein